MMHVNRLDGLTIAVSENKFITQIATRTILSEDALSVLVPILEEVVGQIRSEGEPQGFVMEKLGPGRWRVNGTMLLDDFRREYPDLGDVPDVDTVGGLLVAQLEVVPAAGQSVVFGGLRLTAQATDERRVREVLVELVRKKS